jgi:hypothetical protein
LGLALDEPETNEKPVSVNGIDILVEEQLKGFADITFVDFISSPYGETFTVDTGLGEC